MAESNDFSLKALFDALDAERQARGLSWAQVMGQMRLSERPSARPISQTTVMGLRTKKVAEGDGVLQMIRWLGRSPESFIARSASTFKCDVRLPDIPPNKTLRFDTRKLHAALNDRRIERNLTWAQVAMEARVGVSTLTYLSKASRAWFPAVTRITGWLNRPVAEFTRVSDR